MTEDFNLLLSKVKELDKIISRVQTNINKTRLKTADEIARIKAFYQLVEALENLKGVMNGWYERRTGVTSSIRISYW